MCQKWLKKITDLGCLEFSETFILSVCLLQAPLEGVGGFYGLVCELVIFNSEMANCTALGELLFILLY